jgi:glycosyltransferase involved in cell wall biosynthesis
MATIRSVTGPAVTTEPLVRVSVAIPCFNYGRFLRDCVGSLLAQEGIAIDITIVDDASTDDSLAIARALAAEDRRVTVIESPRHRGHVETFNTALDAATGEYVVKMDADDMVPPGALARAVRLLNAHPEVSFVYGHPQVFGEAAPTELDDRVRGWTIWNGEDWIARVVERSHNVIMQPEVVMRRSAVVAIGGHLPENPEASDLNFWLRLATVGSVARIDGPVQGLYRVHPDSLQRTVHAGYLSDLRGRVVAFDLFFRDRGRLLRRGAQLEARSRVRLARDAMQIAQRAIDKRRDPEDVIAQYLDIASALDPTVTSSRRWRSIRRRSIGSPVTGRSRRNPGTLLRDLEDKVRWRRWRRYGR